MSRRLRDPITFATALLFEAFGAFIVGVSAGAAFGVLVFILVTSATWWWMSTDETASPVVTRRSLDGVQSDVANAPVPVSVPSVAPSFAVPSTRARVPRGCVVALVVVAIVVLVGIAASNGSLDTTTTSQGLPEGSGGGGVGAEGVLRVEGADAVTLARTKDDFDAFQKAHLANDDYGIRALFNSDRIFNVQRDTDVRVIDRSLTLYQVRVLSGPHEGESGWVVVEEVVPR